MTGIILGILSSAASQGTSDTDSMLSTEQSVSLREADVRSRMTMALKQLSSIDLTYESKSYGADKAPAGSYFHKRVVCMEPGFFLLESAHGHDRMRWDDDPYRQIAIVHGTDLWSYFRFDNTFCHDIVAETGPLPGTLAHETILSTVGIWPMQARMSAEVDGHPITLTEISTASKYRLRPEYEMVGNRACNVLEFPPYDALWLDAEYACCVIAREVRDDSSLVPRMRIDMSNHREVLDGLWFPYHVKAKIRQQGGAVVSERNGRCVEFSVLDVKANSIHEDLFSFTPPPESLDVGVSPPRQRASGGCDLPDRIVESIRRLRHESGEKLRLADVMLGAITSALILLLAVNVRLSKGSATG